MLDSALAPAPGTAEPSSGPVTVAFATLGCKLNQYDTTELQALLEARGFRTVSFEEPAQLYVINTCTVTARADYSGRQTIRRAIARNPDAVVVVTGCYAQTNPEAIGAIPGVDLVLGTQDKYGLPELLSGLRKRVQPLVRVSDVSQTRARPPLPPIPLRKFAPGYTRAFVKVQDGCQHRCTFCIVPFARGGSRSQPLGVVLAQVEELVAAGYAEVVLTGVDLGHYGWDLIPRLSLAKLVRRLLEVPGLARLRLSSILPAYFTPELIETVVGEPRVCRHLHIPLQAGSDRVLRAMRRPYNVRIYRALIERLAASMPDLGLGTDVITGFPGESAGEFDETEAVLESLPFTYLHVFSYSDRRGTEAARHPTLRVGPEEIRRRTARLRRLGAAKNLAFRRAHVGRVVEVLVLERRHRTGALAGLTDNYLEAAFEGPDALMRGFARVRVVGPGGVELRGELVTGGAGAHRTPVTHG
ncbi:MAG: tRNA (N(6)-L-threonylcarbamoyladenosine(37)-C(2))-methylthiotransferase MtaB [Candidatus Rokubacteria bacterium]|nr:tRNA (N(6)-L-threonylcarbamoyladenosine(37)-C(2))-methylthiotransferase MtaB [Candidatus Rokubacteria bacterium]